MNRRSFFGALAGLPLVGFLFAPARKFEIVKFEVFAGQTFEHHVHAQPYQVYDRCHFKAGLSCDDVGENEPVMFTRCQIGTPSKHWIFTGKKPV